MIKDFEYCGFNVKGFDLDLLDCFKGIAVADRHGDSKSELDKQKISTVVDHSRYFNRNRDKSKFIMSTRTLPNLQQLKARNSQDFDSTIHSDTEDLSTDYDTDEDEDEDDDVNKAVDNAGKTRMHGDFDSTKSMRYVSQEFGTNANKMDTLHGVAEDMEEDDFKQSNTLRRKKMKRKMKIQMMIYPYGFKDRSRALDLTINTMIIHMSDILIKNKDYNDEYLNFDWKCAIKNPRPQINAIADTIDGKIKCILYNLVVLFIFVFVVLCYAVR